MRLIAVLQKARGRAKGSFTKKRVKDATGRKVKDCN
jgi:hypothetical protein